MTPAGMAVLEKPGKTYLPNGFQPGNHDLPPTNDPFIICDPLGFPRDLLAHAISSRGGTLFGSAPNRIIINYEQQRVWREIWMDGRKLPAKVDAVGTPKLQVLRLFGGPLGRRQHARDRYYGVG